MFLFASNSDLNGAAFYRFSDWHHLTFNLIGSGIKEDRNEKLADCMLNNVVVTADYPVTVLLEMMEAMVQFSWKRYLRTMLTIFEMTVLKILLMIVAAGPVQTVLFVLGKVIGVMVVLVVKSEEFGMVKLAGRLVECLHLMY